MYFEGDNKSPYLFISFMDQAEEIKNLATACLIDESHFIVDVLVSSKKGPRKVLIIMDGDQGVTIDECADVSRKLSKSLDDSDFFKDQYLLEVSSPGLDHPLTLQRQFKKNIGRKLKVVTANKTTEGLLEKVTDEGIFISTQISSGKKKEEVTDTIPFSEIKKAFVLISFK